MTPAEHRQHRIGLLLVAAAALAWSTPALFVRNISADLMTLPFWRGLFSGAGVFALFLLMEGRSAFKVLGTLRWPTLAVAVLSAGAMITGISSLRFTTAANAMVSLRPRCRSKWWTPGRSTATKCWFS